MFLFMVCSRGMELIHLVFSRWCRGYVYGTSAGGKEVMGLSVYSWLLWVRLWISSGVLRSWIGVQPGFWRYGLKFFNWGAAVIGFRAGSRLGAVAIVIRLHITLKIFQGSTCVSLYARHLERRRGLLKP